MSGIGRLERRSVAGRPSRLHRPPHMQGCRGMRIRLLLSSCFVGLASLAAVAPATAAAESFPDKASGYVSDHTGYFVGALLIAILLLAAGGQRQPASRQGKIGERRGRQTGCRASGCGRGRSAARLGATAHRPRQRATRSRWSRGRRSSAWSGPHRGNGRRAAADASRGSGRPARGPRPAGRRRERQGPAPPGAPGAAGQTQRDPSETPRGDQAPQGRARRQTRQAAGRARAPCPRAAAGTGAQAEDLLRDQVRRRQAEARSGACRAATCRRPGRARA